MMRNRLSCRWCGAKVHWGHDKRGKCDACK